MELALLFYLAGVLDNLQVALVILGVFGIIGGVVVCAVMSEAEGTIKGFKRYPLICIFALIFATLLPNKSTIYTMAAAYGVQQAATNPDVQRLAGKSLSLLESKLDEYLPKPKK